MTEFELYFSDLTADAQDRLLDAAGVESHKDMNWDVLPITTIAICDEENEDDN